MIHHAYPKWEAAGIEKSKTSRYHVYFKETRSELCPDRNGLWKRKTQILIMVPRCKSVFLWESLQLQARPSKGCVMNEHIVHVAPK